MQHATPEARVLLTWTPKRDAHRLATDLATELLGTHPGPLNHTCPSCGSIEHGRPSYDAPVHVSIAHSPVLSLVAVSTAGPIGVDVEPHGAADLAWVETEALAKAHGVGLTSPTPAGVSSRLLLDVPNHVAVLMALAQTVPLVEVRSAAAAGPAH